MNKLTLIMVTFAIGLTTCGCSQEARDQYGDAAHDVGSATSKTGQAIATDAENAKLAGDNALQTAKVKSALESASGLDTTDINVDSDTKARTISLNGSVPDSKQRSQAETVAKGMAGNDFRVVNNLKVPRK